MTPTLRIDFVSDIACPWCVLGLLGLEEAIGRLAGDVDVDLHFQPFELSPDMAPEGRTVVDHLAQAYGSTPDEILQRRAVVSDRAAALGFDMKTSLETRVYNSFNAHRLMHWAGLQGRQPALARALFEAYHSRNENIATADVLLDAAEPAGLDRDSASAVLGSDQYANDVRQAEYLWQTRGVTGVPAAIIDGRYLISGAQPAEAYEQALRQIAAQPQSDGNPPAPA
ncbi:putative DsbA family dithiol-disulfide isomerase [Sphingobium sp. B11D3B]|uniref:DsbA family oxidoreductase n=1 Tax=Sphingobium sp. B11D3B TaxID=2940575 RepID=UPI0022262B1B|nr:DsbA family oxidoreductase [Sphingobium sp. B11D3B]MCW2389664.1 putative DsbA family dithiol-disulfide isomerase [Sphingobium sp. B11D3B]